MRWQCNLAWPGRCGPLPQGLAGPARARSMAQQPKAGLAFPASEREPGEASRGSCTPLKAVSKGCAAHLHR
jgi:hypothetical protein